MGLLNSVAAQGRNGDTRMAHVTPGEVVIPREVAALRPDLVEHIGAQVRKMGGNPGTLTVGRGRVNPQTGIEEFATEAEVRAAYEGIGRTSIDTEGLNYWMGQDSAALGAQFGASASNATAQANAAAIDSGYAASHPDVAPAVTVTSAPPNFSPPAPVTDTNPYNMNMYRPHAGPIDTLGATSGNRQGVLQNYSELFGRTGEHEGVDYWNSTGLAGTALTEAMKRTADQMAREAKANNSFSANPVVSNYQSTVDGVQYGFDAQGRPVGQPTKKPVNDYYSTGGNTNIERTATSTNPEHYNPLVQQIDQNGLVRNQMAGLLNSDSKYMQSARLRAMQQGAQSGMLNSSLQATAGEKAASDAALQIATPDAATYNQQHLTNQAAVNTAGQFNANWSNDFAKLEQQQVNALESMRLDSELRGTLQQQLNTFNAEQNRLAREATAANATTSANNTEAASITTTLAGLSSKLTTDINNISASVNIDTNAKAVMINNAIEGYKGQQEALRGRAIAMGFNPGTYFNFETLRPGYVSPEQKIINDKAKADAAATTAPAPVTNPLVRIFGGGGSTFDGG